MSESKQTAQPEARALSSYIDHTLLKAQATREDIELLCREAVDWEFASVCVNPCYVAFATKLLAGTDVKVCAVIGFPLGANTAATKAAEAAEAISNGAREVDMVINVGLLRSGGSDAVKSDIAGVVSAANGKALVKVIIETCFLTDDQKVIACRIAKEAGADFVKTSTGFGKGGATVDDIGLMRRTVGPETGVKASGGIRDTQTARAMIEAGATRLGTSCSIEIVTGKTSVGEY